MPNTNFQTFHQMGQAINEVVRQAIGRDNVQNIDMEHITVAQNHYYQDVDVSGRVVSFHAGAAGLPLEKCVVQIEPVQDLHGYDYPWPAGGGKNLLNPELLKDQSGWNTFTIQLKPNTAYTASSNLSYEKTSELSLYFITEGISPGSATLVSASNSVIITTPESGVVSVQQRRISGIDSFQNYNWQIEEGSSASSFTPYSNICPITGWTGANVYVSPTTDAADGQTYTIAFPSEAGTVYGGTLDVVSGELTIDRTGVDIGSLKWASLLNNPAWRCFTSPVPAKAKGEWNFKCSHYPNGLVYNTETDCIISGNKQNSNIYIRDTHYTDAETFKTAMAGAQLVYKLATPVAYHLTPTEITTLLGVNNIRSDAGDIEVKFKDLKELY